MPSIGSRTGSNKVLYVNLISLFLVMALLSSCAADEPQAARDDDQTSNQHTEEPASNQDTEEPAEGGLRISIGGGGPGSGVYLIAGAVSNVVNTHPDCADLQATAQTTGGGVENTRLTETGETDMGLSPTATVYQAYQGLGPFADEDPYQNLRAVFPIVPSHVQIFTYDEDIEEVADLAGRVVNIGPPGSSSAAASEAVLKAAGIWDGVKPETGDWSEGVRLMQDGQVAAVIILGNEPFPAVVEAEGAPGRTVHFVAMDDAELLANLKKEAPEYEEAVLTANAYGEGKPPEDMASVGDVLYMVASAHSSEDTIYQALGCLLSDEGQEALLETVPFMAGSLETLPGFEPLEHAQLPIHAGALRYWEEQGVDIPAYAIPPEAQQ